MTFAKRKTEGFEVLEYQKYATALALKIKKKYNLSNQLLEDMIAAANLGLVESADKYDPNQHSNFIKYAFLRIRGAVLDCVRENSDLSPAAYRTLKKYTAYQEILEEEARQDNNQNNKKSEKEELATVLDKIAKGALIYKLNYEEEFTEENNALNQCPFSNIERQTLEKLINKLPQKQRTVLIEYYFNDKQFCEIKIDDEFCSKSWISRLHAAGINNLKEMYLNEINNS